MRTALRPRYAQRLAASLIALATAGGMALASAPIAAAQDLPQRTQGSHSGEGRDGGRLNADQPNGDALADATPVEAPETQQLVPMPVQDMGISDEELMEEYIKAGFDLQERPLPQRSEGAGEWAPTDAPESTIQRGQMRSDEEPVPAGFTKAEADKAETMEASLASRTQVSRMAAPGCQVFWPSPNEVCGVILQRYLALGGPQSFLSLPRSNELATPDGIGRRSEFVNGHIYWHPQIGAHSITTHFAIEWGRLGWENSPLGYPTSEEDGVLGMAARVQRFQHGELYGSTLGLAAVHGAIRDRWIALGGAGGELGLPVISEQPTPGAAGRFTVFERGVIYWSAATGAFEITGSILALWLEDDSLFQRLGFPTGSMYQSNERWVQDFQNGKLYAKTALPPWRPCATNAPANQEIRRWLANGGVLHNQVVTLTCGDANYGMRHISRNHRDDWNRLALIEYATWMDIADMAMTKSLWQPGVVQSRPSNNTTCYSGQIYLVNGATGAIAATNDPTVIMSNNNKHMVTAYPGRKCGLNN